jgi:hypothetical protein
MVTLRDIINTNCDCSFNKYVFNGKYRYGLSFYSKILFDTPHIPPWFSANAADLVSELMEKKKNFS